MTNDEPIDISDESLGFVFAYSVFSHLEERLHWKWLREFHRIFAKGGCIAVTLRSENMVRHVISLACKYSNELNSYEVSVVAACLDPVDDLNALARGEFVFRPYQQQASDLGAGYGEACVPEKYVAEQWASLFPDYIYREPSGDVDRAVVVARKGLDDALGPASLLGAGTRGPIAGLPFNLR